jgi:hypothetical protein
MINNIYIMLQLTVICFVFTALQEPGMIFAWYARLLNKLPDWLAFPLGACHKCLTGQVLLWYFLFKGTPIVEHLFLISSGIFISSILNKLWEKLES